MQISGVLSAIWGWVRRLSWKDWLVIVLGVISTVSVIRWVSSKQTIHQNIIVYQDSLGTYENRIRELYVKQQTYVAEVNDLKTLNKELYDEIKKLKDSPLIVTKTEYEVVMDPFVVTDTIVQPSDSVRSYVANWSKKDEYVSMSGLTCFDLPSMTGTTVVNSLRMHGSLFLDVIETKTKPKSLQIIARSDNPYFRIDRMNGAIINNGNSTVLKKYSKNDHWGIGVTLGYGVGYYDNKFIMAPMVIGGITYNFFTF